MIDSGFRSWKLNGNISTKCQGCERLVNKDYLCDMCVNQSNYLKKTTTNWDIDKELNILQRRSTTWGDLIKKEKEMKVTKQQVDKFSNMVVEFAQKHGLNVEIDTGSPTCDMTKVIFSKGLNRSREYIVEWKDTKSLTDAATKIFTDISIKWFLEKPYVTSNNLAIKKVIFNYPATIVLWEDGTKTVVKCGEEDFFDHEKGLAMAIAKKALGNQGNYFEVFKKHITPEQMNRGIKDVPNMYPSFMIHGFTDEQIQKFKDIVNERFGRFGMTAMEIKEAMTDISDEIHNTVDLEHTDEK